MGEIFSVKKSGDMAIVEILKQEITMYEIDKVKKEFSDIIEKDSKNILVNFKKLEFISSLVIAALVYLHKKAKENNGKLKFCELTPKVKEIFEVTDLDKVFDVYPTESAAIAKFAEEGIK
jgi:anti-sigma B factor antagonist